MFKGIQKWKFFSQLKRSSTCKSLLELKRHKCSAVAAIQKGAAFNAKVVLEPQYCGKLQKLVKIIE